MSRQFRGITGVVRNGINNGAFKGQITYNGVRALLSGAKKVAPDNVIRASLNRMSRLNEIQKVHNCFYTKDIKPMSIEEAMKPTAAPTMAPAFPSNAKIASENVVAAMVAARRSDKSVTSKHEVCVLGKLVDTKLVDGRMIAHVEVTSLDYK